MYTQGEIEKKKKTERQRQRENWGKHIAGICTGDAGDGDGREAARPLLVTGQQPETASKSQLSRRPGSGCRAQEQDSRRDTPSLQQ